MEINELNLIQLLSLVQLPPAINGDHGTLIDPLTIPCLNHHMLDINCEVVTSLSHSLEQNDPLSFLDLDFVGTLYQINRKESHTKSKGELISFTGFEKYAMSYSLVGSQEELPDLELKMDVVPSGDLLAKIRDKQEKFSLRLAPSEGIHRIFVFVNQLHKLSKSDQSGVDYLRHLMKRKVKLVLLFPKPQQLFSDFLEASYKASRHVEKLRKVVAPHTFLDDIKNCQYTFKTDPKFIAKSGFFSDKSCDWNKGQPIIDKLFIEHLKKNELLQWQEVAAGSGFTPINKTTGMLLVGRRHFINSVMKANDPWSPNLSFLDVGNNKQINLCHKEISLYCFLIVMCYSEQSFNLIEQCLKSYDSIFFSNHRVSKYHKHKYFLSRMAI